MSKKKEIIYEPKAENDWDNQENWKYFNCTQCGGREGTLYGTTTFNQYLRNCCFIACMYTYQNVC